jgi:hypothetical protein
VTPSAGQRLPEGRGTSNDSGASLAPLAVAGGLARAADCHSHFLPSARQPAILSRALAFRLLGAYSRCHNINEARDVLAPGPRGSEGITLRRAGHDTRRKSVVAPLAKSSFLRSTRSKGHSMQDDKLRRMLPRLARNLCRSVGPLGRPTLTLVGKGGEHDGTTTDRRGS